MQGHDAFAISRVDLIDEVGGHPQNHHQDDRDTQHQEHDQLLTGIVPGLQEFAFLLDRHQNERGPGDIGIAGDELLPGRCDFQHPGLLGKFRNSDGDAHQRAAEKPRSGLQHPLRVDEKDIPLAAHLDFGNQVVELLGVDGGPQDVKAPCRQIVLYGHDQVELLPEP